ncbi:hypothetical protein ES708_29594 [subsurface metagenome]
MTSKGYALARAELIRALTAYSGITTDDGEAGGTTLVDSNLIGRNDFISEKTILIMSGDAKDEDKGATSFDNSDGKITLQGTGFSAQIKAGTIFRVLNISSIEIDVANIDAKIGTNVDAPGTTTLFAWLAKLFTQGGQGLVYYGKVTQVDDATHFRVAGLTGFGDAYFTNNYRVYVVRDAAGGGAAPQGEMQPCSAYTSSDGTFTHTTFSVGLAVDDEVLLLHERVAEVADIVAALVVIAGYVDELETRLTAQRATNLDWLDLTTFKQEAVGAIDVNGTTWKDLLDKSTITKPTKICGFKVTVAGAWAGKAQVRITDGAGTKIFPFQDYYEQDDGFVSGTQVAFNFPVVVPVADGYKFQFRSTDVADGAGETLELNNLDVIEVG